MLLSLPVILRTWGILDYAGDVKLLDENINTIHKHTDANEEVGVELKDKKTYVNVCILQTECRTKLQHWEWPYT